MAKKALPKGFKPFGKKGAPPKGGKKGNPFAKKGK